MSKVQYGNKTIEYSFKEKKNLNAHYITVERGQGVILKGESIPEEKKKKLILKKARWILEKLEVVRSIEETDIVTGSRIPYLGKRYYVEVFFNKTYTEPKVEFTYSKFKIFLPNKKNIQPTIQKALRQFFKKKALIKIAPRVIYWSEQTGLTFNELKFLTLEKRWGSCTPKNNIIINTEAIKLPFSLIDYLIVHELCHTKVKNHSKEFWAEVSKYISNWQELDEKMKGWKM